MMRLADRARHELNFCKIPSVPLSVTSPPETTMHPDTSQWKCFLQQAARASWWSDKASIEIWTQSKSTHRKNGNANCLSCIVACLMHLCTCRRLPTRDTKLMSSQTTGQCSKCYLLLFVNNRRWSHPMLLDQKWWQSRFQFLRSEYP